MQELEVIEVKSTQNTHSAKFAIIWLHGLGASGEDFLDATDLLNLPKDFAVNYYFPHAPIRPITLNGNMPMRAWFDLYSLDSLTRQDEAGLNSSKQLLENLLVKINQEDQIEFSNMILVGFSQGGVLALYTALSAKYNLAGVACLSGWLPMEDKLSEYNNAKSNLPIFLGYGQFDPMVPIALGRKTQDSLNNAGFALEYYEYPIEHSVSQAELLALGKWVAASCLY